MDSNPSSGHTPRNFAEGPEIPLGLGMALAQDLDAMNTFASFPPQRKRQVIQETHRIRSSAEMRAYVAGLARPGVAPSSFQG